MHRHHKLEPLPDAVRLRCKVDEIQVDLAANRIRPGQIVRVRQEILIPKFEWGGVNHSSFGIVESVTHDGIAVVDFPSCCRWHGLVSELEVEAEFPQPLRRKRVALVIGNHTFKDKKAYPALDGVLNDARATEKKLIDLRFDYVLPVMNMCRRDLDSFLRQLEQQVVDGSIVLIYFAGHGEEDQQSVVLPGHDSDSRDRDSKIDTDLIFNAVAQWSSKDLFVCFVLDCCRLKSDDCGSSSRLTAQAPIPEDIGWNQFYWVHSCQKFKAAFEKEHGDFSRCFLQFLGEDLSVQQLFEQVTQQLEKHGRRQRPQILQEGHEASRIKLASANNIYRPSSLAAQGVMTPGSSDGSVGSGSEHVMDRVERLKDSIQEGNQRDIIDHLHDVRELLGSKLFEAVENAVLQGDDPLMYADGLGQWELQMFRTIFTAPDIQPAHGPLSQQPRGVPQQHGRVKCSVPDCVLRLSQVVRNFIPGTADRGCKAMKGVLMDMEQALSPRLLLAIKSALCHHWIAKWRQPKQVQHQVLHADSLVADAGPTVPEGAFDDMECWVGQKLLPDLFDDSYCANLAFILKLVQEKNPSATRQVALAQAVWQDPVLALSKCFVSLMTDIFTGKCQVMEDTASQRGLAFAEAEIFQNILEFSDKNKESLLKFIPVPECVHRLGTLVSEPLLALWHSQLEGCSGR